MMKNKLMAALFTISMLFIFAGCGAKEAAGPAKTEPAAEETGAEETAALAEEQADEAIAEPTEAPTPEPEEEKALTADEIFANMFEGVESCRVNRRICVDVKVDESLLTNYALWDNNNWILGKEEWQYELMANGNAHYKSVTTNNSMGFVDETEDETYCIMDADTLTQLTYRNFLGEWYYEESEYNPGDLSQMWIETPSDLTLTEETDTTWILKGKKQDYYSFTSLLSGRFDPEIGAGIITAEATYTVDKESGRLLRIDYDADEMMKSWLDAELYNAIGEITELCYYEEYSDYDAADVEIPEDVIANAVKAE